MGLTQITTGGVDDNINIDSNTLKVDGTNNRVGIGTASPTNKLQIASGYIGVDNGYGLTTVGGLKYIADSDNNAPSAGVLHNFYTDNATTSALAIQKNGNVGIGTSSPGFKLEVNSGTSDSVALFKSSDTTARIILRDNGSTSGGYVGVATEDMFFHTNGTERLRIDSSGNARFTQSIRTTASNGSTIIGEFGRSSLFITGGSQDDLGVRATGHMRFATGGNTERMRIDSSGNVGIGTSSPTSVLHIKSDANNDVNNGILFEADDSTDKVFRLLENGTGEAYSEWYHQDSLKNVIRANGNSYFNGGNVGIGTASNYADSKLEVRGTNAGGDVALRVTNNSTTSGSQAGVIFTTTTADYTTAGIGYERGTNALKFYVGQSAPGGGFDNATERVRIDSSGRLLVGTTTEGQANADNLTVADSANCGITIRSGTSNSGNLYFSDATSGNGEYAGAVLYQHGDERMMFYTNSTERIRIFNNGNIAFDGRGVISSSGAEKVFYYNNGHVYIGDNDHPPLFLNRNNSDGNILVFRQANSDEGTISVSGSTVSYNGAHLSRWSQLAGNAERTEILRGSVLSNLDEMCEWGEEDNEQLNRMKVSDVEGDVNVSGVFQGWDDDDDTYINDFYCAMTGDFVIRIAQGTTVTRGDLLMSAGDGTAKPQDDDIVRSKTVAKVTSTTVSTTYSDGSYCVPCVLMAC